MLPLNALILVPISVYFWARSYRPEHKYSCSGAAFGFIIVPFSMGLYILIYLVPNVVGYVLGMMGYFSTFFHSSFGYDLSVFFGFLEPKEVVNGLNHYVIIYLVEGIVWGLAYGCVGYGIDTYLKRKESNNVLT